MRKSWLAISAATLAGAVGAVLRRIEVNTVFEAETGLVTKSAPVSIALAGMSIGVFAAIVLFAAVFSKNTDAKKTYPRAFKCDKGVFTFIGVLAGIAIIAAHAITVIFSYYSMLSGIPHFAYVFLGTLTGISVILISVNAHNGKGGKLMTLAGVVPALYFCYLMAITYMRSASSPALQEYCFSCLAYGAASAGFYYEAGYVYGRAKPMRVAASRLAALYFLILNLGSELSVPTVIVSISTIVYIAISTACYFKNGMSDGNEIEFAADTESEEADAEDSAENTDEE